MKSADTFAVILLTENTNRTDYVTSYNFVGGGKCIALCQ